MTRDKFTERQSIALAHPCDRSGDARMVAPIPVLTRNEGKWRTILETCKLGSGIGWVWGCSISRRRGPGRIPYRVAQWKTKWFSDADRMLAELLQGVGEDPFGMDLDPDVFASYYSWLKMTPHEILWLPEGVK